MNKRRDFLKYCFGSAACLTLGNVPLNLWAQKEVVKITILHTNDVHSHVDPFPDNDPKYPGLGGAARRASLIKQIRTENPNVLLLDAGDVFQGTPYFNHYGGELEFKLMTLMGYDACTLGNHDFDNGLEGLSKQLPNAGFPFICSNYNFADTLLCNQTLPYKIFEKEEIKIGVFGLGIELTGLVDKKNYGNTLFQDPLLKAAEYTHLLKKELKCDLIICLSHLGYKYADDKKISDIVLAKHSKDIDLIIGAHTHTFLEKPLSVRNRDRKEVWVAQAGWAGINLGKIDFYYAKNKRQKQAEGSTIKILKNASMG